MANFASAGILASGVPGGGSNHFVVLPLTMPIGIGGEENNALCSNASCNVFEPTPEYI